ncbi:MAG TPA: GntR family transcriptional regulator [Clostridiaceae bacterium]|nr:GntR family transcriptional regulator [Clostridiaceae bacterium]
MLLKLDFSSDVPIYLQIRNQIVMGIAEGKLSPGEKLPTVRALAVESGINVMTVNKAYALLKQEGYILADRRSGAIINPDIAKPGFISDKTKNDLKLVISEIKLAGVSREELLNLCGQLYDETGETR